MLYDSMHRTGKSMEIQRGLLGTREVGMVGAGENVSDYSHL